MGKANRKRFAFLLRIVKYIFDENLPSCFLAKNFYNILL